jgi:hypothetical protein
MSNPQKRKGDAAELEAARIIHDLTGFPARRKLGAGRTDDTGDIDGIPSTVIQVANWRDVTAALRAKPLGAEVQRINDQATFAATFLRLRGGLWRVVLTPEQWAVYASESLP